MHNLSLPTHRYVFVRGEETTGSAEWIPAVWFGVSSTPGRALGCHVLLENGAMLSDLPLHWLGTRPHQTALPTCQTWDCFGHDLTVTELSYLNLLEARILTERHKPTRLTGQCWFTLDWLDNGWSSYPEQHKLMHLMACSDGSLRLLPTDRLLWRDTSFTVDGEVPRILRQRKVWSAE